MPTWRRERNLSNQFVKEYGLDREAFIKYFLEDEGSIEHMGYQQSWAFIWKDAGSVKRYTNIECLIRRLMSEDGLDTC